MKIALRLSARMLPATLLSITLFSVLLTGLEGCKKKISSSVSSTGSSNEVATADLKPVKNDWLVLLLEANPPVLNPILATDGYSVQVFPFVFDQLIAYRASDGVAEGRLAEKWEVSKDGKTYDFFLRKNATFHDGKPVTAEDVKFSFDLIKNPKIDAAHMQNYFSDLESTEVVDPYHVRFHLKQIYYRHLIILGSLNILPKHIYGVGDFNTLPANRAPVGSGPYRFSKWENGRMIELQRNDKWWGVSDPIWKDRFNFNKVLFRIISEPNVALMAMRKGQIDSLEPNVTQWLNDLNGPEVEKDFYKLRYESRDGNGYGYIGWNLESPKFNSKKTRQALAMLMPREEIGKKIYGGMREMAVADFPSKSPKTSPDLKPFAYDKEKAKALLAEDGWKDSDGDGILDKNGQKLQFELLLGQGTPENERVALIYRESLKEVGIEMGIRALEFSVYLKTLNERNFDAFLISWGSSLDGDPYQVWHSSQTVKGGSNRVGFKNEKADKLLEEARITLDTDKRNKIYQEFSLLIADEAPYLFLFERPNLAIIAKRFQGVMPVGELGTDPAIWYTPAGREKYTAEQTPEVAKP